MEMIVNQLLLNSSREPYLGVQPLHEVGSEFLAFELLGFELFVPELFVPPRSLRFVVIEILLGYLISFARLAPMEMLVNQLI